MTIDSSTIEAISDLARGAAGSEQLEPGTIHAFMLGDQVELVDLTADQYRTHPVRKRGTVRVSDVASFGGYWGKHSTAGTSEVYADRAARTVTAVLDAHGPDWAGWQQHRLVLTLEYSDALKAWLERDGKVMDQESFAEFLDDQRADIREPSAADMLEIAQTIQGTSKVDWQAGHRLVDGQRRIGYLETNTATAGQKGELVIPTQIVIGVQVFDGSEVAHALTARFRHRVEGGRLRLLYKLDRPGEVVTSAFDAAVGVLGEACGAAVLRGTPS